MKQKNKIKYGKLKFLALYEIIITAIVILFSIYSLIIYKFFPYNFIVAVIGLVGGIMLLRKMKTGFYFSIAWAVLQMFNIYLNGTSFDLTQILAINLTINMKPEYDFIFTFNIFGLLFLILLLKWRKELK